MKRINTTFAAERAVVNVGEVGIGGRNAIAEILILNDEIRELIVAQEPIRRIKEAARNNGTRFLREAALDMVKQGLTSLEEANRVTIVA